MLFKIAILSISLSIDALGIGMSYQLRGVKITWTAKFIVGLMAVVVSLGAVCLGNQVMEYFPMDVVRILGTALLCLIGIVFIRKGLYEEGEVFCDMDRSSTIEPWEAVLLGAALSADSISTGIAVATLGINNIGLPLMVGISQPLFLMAGEWIGKKSRIISKGNQKICGIFSGMLLIFIAIIQNLG